MIVKIQLEPPTYENGTWYAMHMKFNNKTNSYQYLESRDYWRYGPGHGEGKTKVQAIDDFKLKYEAWQDQKFHLELIDLEIL